MQAAPQQQLPPQQPYNGYPQQPQPIGMPQAQFQQPQIINTVHQQQPAINIDVKGCRISGGSQLIFGMLILIFGIVSISIDCQYSYIGTAIWGGIWFMVCGFIGASATRAGGSSTHCLLTSYLVLCIFSIIYAFDLIVTMSVAVSQEGPIYSFNDHTYWVSTSKAARIAIDSILLALGVLEVGAACWGLGVASKTACGSRNQTVQIRTQPVVAYTTTTGPGYYGNPPGIVAVTAQYPYTSQNAQPGPAMPPQATMYGSDPPPYQQKTPISEP